jgi:hypothetical protein
VRRINRSDILICLGFALLSLLTLAGRWQSSTVDLRLSSDAANIASFAAALDHPDHFRGDGVLGDPKNFRFYLAVHIPLIRWLENTFGDYGVSFVALLAPHALLHLVGFYVFGRVLFRSRLWAAVLSLMAFAPLNLHVGTFWGMYVDAIPRVTFQVLLPFVLASAVHWRNLPAAWPLILGATGLLTYVHPVSAPVWGLVLWAGFLTSHPTEWNRAKRAGHALLTGGAFLLVITPWILHYLQNFEFGESVDYDVIREAMAFRFMEGTLDPPKAVLDFLMRAPEVFVIGIPAIACSWFLDPATRNRQRIVHVWIIGLLVASAIIPSLEHAIARANQTMHLEIDFVRNLRYLIPLAMAFWIWSFAAWHRNDLGFTRPVVVGLIFLLSWVGEHRPPLIVKAIRNFASGHLIREDPVHASLRKATDALVKLTGPEESIFSTFAPVNLRYAARRGGVYSFKDGGILSYANHEQMIRWYDDAIGIRRMQALQKERMEAGEWEAVLDGYESYGRKLGARILFLKLPVDTAPRERGILYWAGGFYISRIPVG